MPKKRFQPEEITGKLRQADVLLGQGKKVADVVKALGVTDVTCGANLIMSNLFEENG